MWAVWVVGGVVFYLCNERRKPLPLYETLMVSILVPCFNEAETIENTISELSKIQHPNYEIISINDGSIMHDACAWTIKGLFKNCLSLMPGR